MNVANWPLAEFFCLDRKFLLYNFLTRNLKLRYRRSTIGYLWTLLVPLSQVGIYYFVYRVILNIATPHYLSFLISGILPWTFFVSSLNEAMESMVEGHHLLIHAPVPIQLFPASATFTNFVNLMAASPLLFLVAGLEMHAVSTWWIGFYPLAAALLLFTYSLGFLLACLYVYLRDLKHLISLVVQLWLYVTPILYRVEMIPQKYKWLLWVNPLAGFFISLRELLFEMRPPNAEYLGIFMAWSLALLLLADWIRRRYAYRLVEKL